MLKYQNNGGDHIWHIDWFFSLDYFYKQELRPYLRHTTITDYAFENKWNDNNNNNNKKIQKNNLRTVVVAVHNQTSDVIGRLACNYANCETVRGSQWFIISRKLTAKLLQHSFTYKHKLDPKGRRLRKAKNF